MQREKQTDDLVSRKATIDALNVGAELLRRVLDDADIVGAERAKYEWGFGLIESYIADVKALPSAQPETHEKRTETHACDCISRQAAIEAVYKCADIFAGDMPVMVVKADAYEALAQLPSAQPVAKDIDAPNTDTISRQDAIRIVDGIDTWQAGWRGDAIESMKALPPAQPELPEWAQKVEEYRKSAPSFVRNQLVWALYQTWKEYDGRLVHQRGKENR